MTSTPAADPARPGSRRARARRVRPPLSTQGRSAAQARHRCRGARSLAPSRARADRPRRVHPADRADGAGRALHDLLIERALSRWSRGADAASTWRCRSTCARATCSIPSFPRRSTSCCGATTCRPSGSRSRSPRAPRSPTPTARSPCSRFCARAGSRYRSMISAPATPRSSIYPTLPASELKIDRSFITGMLEDPRADAIVRSTIDLARNLGLTVVAEGIETEAVMERLRRSARRPGRVFYLAAVARRGADRAVISAFGIGERRDG